MLRASIVGCGKIAEAHAEVIKFSPLARLVATCDREKLMAKQMSERFGAENYYDDLSLLIKEKQPDVVHITTPPHSHYILARKCLESNCHVFVEKPFTISVRETEDLLALAKSRGLKITVGTDEQFSAVAMEMRKLVVQGWLGKPPYHLDIYYGYELGDERYAQAFLKNREHWLWVLPGQLIQNLLPHAIMKAVEFLESGEINVMAIGFTSSLLKKLGEERLKDELRAIITDKTGTTAYITFSTQIRPASRMMLIFGSNNGLLVDQEHHGLIKLEGKSYKSYLEKTWPLKKLAGQYHQNMFRNIWLFLKREFQMKRGLYNLIDLFYRSILSNGEPPIPYQQIRLCSEILDKIIASVYDNKPRDIG
ncbi:MAG: Gfo/Idh/MocA family protein [Candidatus Saccharicenans sp.]